MTGYQTGWRVVAVDRAVKQSGRRTLLLIYRDGVTIFMTIVQ